jgi:hypothetical protein
MKRITTLPLVFIASLSLAQTPFPVIKASSRSVSIDDGGSFGKDAWSLHPKRRPDTYTADRTRKTKWVTFFTDIDSIRVKVRPGTRYNFIILLDGKDSCYTQIASAIPPDTGKQPTITDTLRFTLTAFNAIAFKAIINGTDTLNLHFDASDWNVRLMRPIYRRLKKISTLRIGSLVFNDPPTGATDKTAHDMDGRFGWNLFEGKQIELNYDSCWLLVHSGKFPRIPKSYRRSKLTFRSSYPVVTVSMKKDKTNCSGEFLLDTGSDQAIILDSSWAAATNFASGLPLKNTITLHDPNGKTYETRVVLAPAFDLGDAPRAPSPYPAPAGATRSNIPALILGTRNPTGLSINFLGNDLLKRFNIILDFRHDRIGWKPNHLAAAPYRENS